MRMSTSTCASAATTLVRVPPAITPGFTVIPCFRLVNAAIFGIWRASSTTALAPALIVDAGVRRFSFHRDGVIADAFARGLEFALESRSRLEQKRNRALPRGLFGERPRSFAADFFIRIHLKQDIPAHWDFEHAKGVDRVNKERDARFHVEHARPPQAALLLAERHLRERAERPDRIGMRQHQDFAGVGFRRPAA